MIEKTKKHNPANSIAFKLLAFCIGYGLWYIFSSTQIITLSLSIPLCFDTANESRTIKAPESITVTISGKRKALFAMDFEALAAHINADQLTAQEHTIRIRRQDLFLPEHINLIHYEPSPLVISIEDQSIINQEQPGVHG